MGDWSTMLRRRIVVITGLVGVVVTGGARAVGFRQYHAKPQFFGTGDLMDPYGYSWKGPD